MAAQPCNRERRRRADFARFLRRTGREASSALLRNDGGRMREEKFPSSFNTTHLVLNMRPRSGVVLFFAVTSLAHSFVGGQLNAAQVLFVLPFYLARARPSPSHFFPISPSLAVSPYHFCSLPQCPGSRGLSPNRAKTSC